MISEKEKPIVSIIIATHKKYQMPSDKIYLPLYVGAAKKENEGLDIGYQTDATGDNISEKNPCFCELTALYWGWKNLHCTYMGLVHYRRHFCLKKKSKNPFDNILKEGELLNLLNSSKVILPKKRKYYIETLYSHYSHTHYAEHLDVARQIVVRKFPQYVQCFDEVMNRKSGYMFNMVIMEKALMDQYCQWLFDILFVMEERLGEQELSFYQGRFYGRVSEILFNVWLLYQLRNKKIENTEIKELSYIHMEKINWIHKGSSFLKAKFIHKKYEGSF